MEGGGCHMAIFVAAIGFWAMPGRRAQRSQHFSQAPASAKVRRNKKGEPMGLSDWIGIFAIITFVGFAGMFYEVATRVFDERAPCASQYPAGLYVLQGGSTAGPSH